MIKKKPWIGAETAAMFSEVMFENGLKHHTFDLLSPYLPPLSQPHLSEWVKT